MNETSKKIMEVFREFRVGKNEFFPIQSLMSRVNDWDRGHKDSFDESIVELIKEGYIKESKRPIGYILTEKGYEYLYLKR